MCFTQSYCIVVLGTQSFTLSMLSLNFLPKHKAKDVSPGVCSIGIFYYLLGEEQRFKVNNKAKRDKCHCFTMK